MSIIHKVKCFYCQQIFDRDKIEAIKVNGNRYAHKECAVAAKNTEKQEFTDKEKLDDYIKQLYKVDFVPPKMQKQINTYIKQYNYTHSGMLKALVYFYEVKKNDITKSNDSLGILPYIYTEAYNYYYNLWLANQQNQDKDISSYKPIVKEVKIPPPQRKIRKRKLFTFLEEDDI